MRPVLSCRRIQVLAQDRPILRLHALAVAAENGAVPDLVPRGGLSFSHEGFVGKQLLPQILIAGGFAIADAQETSRL
jgi:hypothetical protein